MPGELAIYRMSALTDREATLSDKIEFEGGTVPDGRSWVNTASIHLGRTRTDNPAPGQNQARKPDSGFKDDTYTINVTFDESTGTAGGIATLRNWLREDTTTDIFQNGRFGLRNDYRPEFDLRPTATAGYKLVEFSPIQNLMYNEYVEANIVLEFGGLPARLGI